MDKKQAFKAFLTKLEVFAKKLGNLIVLTLALVAGFFIGYYYWVMTHKAADRVQVENVKELRTTSVAINERDELMIIDRKSGRYTIYQDSVGIVVFKLYANKIYKQTQPSQK